MKEIFVIAATIGSDNLEKYYYSPNEDRRWTKNIFEAMRFDSYDIAKEYCSSLVSFADMTLISIEKYFVNQ